MKRALLSLSIFSLLWSAPALAQSPVVAVVLMDMHPSASRFRIPEAAALFMSRLAEADFAGAYAIGSKAEKKRVVTAITTMSGSEKARALREVRHASTRRDRRALGDALDAATGQLAAFEIHPRIVVIITAEADVGEAAGWLPGPVQFAADEKVQLHFVALGDADPALLRVAAQKTGGQVYRATDAASLDAAMERVSANVERARAGKPTAAEVAPAVDPTPHAGKPAGTESAGSKPAGTEPAGSKPAGTESAGSKPAGSKPAGSKPAGASRKASDADGAKTAQKGSSGRDPVKTAKKPHTRKRPKRGRGPKKVSPEDEDEPDEESANGATSDKGESAVSSVSSASAKAGTPLWVWLAAGGGGLLLIGIIVLMIIRRRRGDDDDEPEVPRAVDPSFNAASHFGAAGAAGKGGGGGGGPAKVRLVPLVGSADGFSFSSSQGTLKIGRKPANDIVLDHRGCSGFHAELRWEGGQLTVVDTGSTNGTFVNDQRIREQALAEGDILRFDAVAYRVEGQVEAAAGGGAAGSAGAAEPAQDERTMMLSADDPYLQQLLASDEAPAPPVLDRQEEKSVVLEHRFCVRHKNRIAQQLCDVCSLPFCSQCLQDVLGEEVCPKCRAAGHGT